MNMPNRASAHHLRCSGYGFGGVGGVGVWADEVRLTSIAAAKIAVVRFIGSVRVELRWMISGLSVPVSVLVHSNKLNSQIVGPSVDSRTASRTF